MATRVLTPVAGFVIKTHKTAAQAYEASGKVFVNITSHDSIERACGYTGLPIDDDHLDNKGLGNLQLPLLVGPRREIQDNSGHAAIAVDVIFHPSLVQRAINGSPQFPAEHFKGALVTLALKNVVSEYNMQIDQKKVVFLERLRYKGAPGETPSNTHGFSVTAAPEPAAPVEPKDSGPKIEVLGEMPEKKKNQQKSAKPIMKKGFFDKPNKFAAEEEEELYPDGSAEGVPKEGQQDPAMSWLPENVRNKCHIVDTRQLSQDKVEATMKEYGDTGRLATERPGVHRVGTAGMMQAEPGIGHPKHLRESQYGEKPTAAPSKAEPPKPKKEPPPKPVPDSLFKFVGQQEEPVHRITETISNGAEAICVIIELPDITSITQVSLDVSAKLLQVRGGKYRLKLNLPKKVNSDQVKAKFVAKRKELKVTAPVIELD